MGKLEDLRVGRVDGVERPAIKKRWVLVKSEDAAPSEVEKDYAGAARVAVEALAKEGVEFSDETIEALKSLVELLELDIEFKSVDLPETPQANGDVDENGDVEKTFSAEEVEELLAKALRAAGVNADGVVAKSDGDAIGRITPSRQPRGQDDPNGNGKTVKKGEGLFANIVHQRATSVAG
jgi:hypothetical protein